MFDSNNDRFTKKEIIFGSLGFTLPFIAAYTAPYSIYVIIAGIVCGLIVWWIKWILDRRHIRKMYSGRKLSGIGSYFSKSFSAARWIALCVILIAGCFAILKCLPNWHWLYFKNEDGDWEDRRIAFSTVIGLLITAVIGHKLSQKKQPTLPKQENPVKNEKQFSNNWFI